MSIRNLAWVLVAAAATAAVAGDDAAQPAAPPTVATPPAATPAPTPFKCKATLANGRSFSGVVLVSGVWEKQDGHGVWSPCAKEDRSARVRLWYVGGRAGFVGLAASDVTTVENLGAFDARGADQLAAEKAAAEKQARDEREQLHKERDAKRAAAAAEAEKATKAAEDAATAKKTEAAATAAKAAAELLARFPPEKWSAERRDEIRQRAFITHVQPSDEERDFVEQFEAWSSAAAAAKAADAKRSEPKADEAKKDAPGGK